MIKNYNLILLLLLLTCENIYSQRITLNELQTFCTNKNWETTNKNLLLQKWDYYDSTKGDDEHYDLITWANGRNYNNDKKATAWLTLYNYDDLPNRIMYRFRQKEYYTAIQSQLKSFGYGLTDESIHDEKVVATYENMAFVLKIAYKREVDEDEVEDNYYSNSKRAFTVYEASIYKKGGVFDPNNGYKKDYDDEGNLEFDYFLKNSKLEGKATAYNSEGKVTGLFNFKNGNKHGKNSSYQYIDESDIYIETVRNYKDGNLNGKRIEYVISPDEKYISKIFSYKNNVLEGKAFQSRKSVIEEMNYKNNVLEGYYKEYLDMKSVLYGGLGRIDTLSMPKLLLLEQNYSNDKLEGFAKRYDISGVKIAEGSYTDSLKTGTWKYYYDTQTNSDGSTADGSGELHWIVNYKNGLLDGASETFSVSENVVINCPEGSNKDEECYKRVIGRFHLISNYKEDALDGFYEMKRSNGELLSRGQYKTDLKDGKWMQYSISRFSDLDVSGRSYETGNYKNNLKEGPWERFSDDQSLLESYHYKLDKIDGKHITYKNGLPVMNKYFNFEYFNKFEVLENRQVKRSVEIISENSNFYKLKDIFYSGNGTELLTIKIDKKDDFLISSANFPSTYEHLLPELKIKEGLYELTTKGKQILSTGNYVENLKHGVWKDFYYNQNVQITTMWQNGIIESEDYWDTKKLANFSGEFNYFDNDNKITEERKIKNGKRHGTTRYKDENDKTIKKESYKEGSIKE